MNILFDSEFTESEKSFIKTVIEKMGRDGHSYMLKKDENGEHLYFDGELSITTTDSVDIGLTLNAFGWEFQDIPKDHPAQRCLIQEETV